MLIQGILIFTLLNESLCKISSNMIIYKINRNEHNHRYDIPINIKEIKFSCSFGTKWFIPSTIPKQLQPIIEVNTNQTQSMLYIQLPENNSLHVNYRGLYQCCQTFNKDDIGKLNWLPYEPFCCPCCPWYEQNNCLFKQIQLNNSTNIILKLKNASFYCGSAFLYTNTINTETIYLHVLRNQPMLIPCPGLNTTFKSKEITTFSIDYQLTPHKSSKQLWYPFKQLNQFNSILYYYDNRFGLCLIKSQFPRIMLFMLCNYKQIHQQRIIQPIWSLTSPVIPPTIHLYLQSINTVDYNTHQLIDNNNNSVYFLKNINWFIKYTDDIITFRIMKHITMLQLTCIGSYSQKYIVQKPIDKLCFTWRLLNEINEIPTDIYEFRKHDQFDNQSMQTRTECLSTHQTFNKLPILFAYSNYHVNLLKTINITNQLVNNNTFIQCEVTTPDRIAPISQKIIQIIQVTNKLSNKFHMNLHCNCLLLTSNRSSLPSENSTFNLFIKNDTLNMNITFWTEYEIDEQPFCILMKSTSMHYFNQLMKDIQINLIRTRYTWNCYIKMKLNMPSYIINLSVGYNETKKILQLFIVKSIMNSFRTIENLHSQITQQYNLYCIPSNIERKIIQQLGYKHPTNITWFISIDNLTQNYTTYNNTLIHQFNLMPIFNTTYYSNLVINKNEYLWKQYNDIVYQSNLFSLYNWPKKLCIKCISNYEFGLSINGEEICSIINDFNVNILFNSTINDEYKQINQKKKKQLYFTIEMNNSTKYYEINKQFNNSIIFLNQGMYITLECIRQLYIKPKLIKQDEWPEIIIINTPDNNSNSNNSDNNNNNTSKMLSPYSMKVKKTISSYKQTIMHVKCSFQDEQYTIKFYPLKQIKPKILKPSNDIQLINHTLYTNNNNNNITGHNLELKCQAIGSPKPTIQWMKAIYNEYKIFIKWEIVQQCLPDLNQIQFNMNIINIENEIHTCTLNISLLSLWATSMNALNQSYYQCLAENSIGNTLKQIKLIYLDTTYISNTSINNIKLYVIMKNIIIWIFLIILSISLILIIFSIVICLYYKVNYKNQYTSDISLPNILYKHIYNHFHSYQLKLSQSSTSPSLLSSSYDSSKQYKSVEHMLGELLGLTTNDTTNIKTTPTTTTTTTPMKTTINHSINQINKWIIPRKFIKLSNYSLGFGHYGSVYKAWLSSSYIKDKLNNQFNDILLKENIDKYIVAIKASSSSLVARQNIHHDNNNNNNNLLCLRNEIRILTNLTNCENIIKMIGIMFEHKLKTSKNLLNNVNLILEYCQYKSLSHFIQYHSYQITNSLFNYEEIQCNKVNTIHDSKIIEEYQLTVKELYRFAYGIISGIVYLTRNYVIHRDLATRNILINHNYIPKISDFGLAVQLTPLNALINDSIYNYDDEFNEDQLIDEYYRVLTPRKKLPLRILPPEALLQHKFYFSSDIWQYGLLIWELFHLERREPFQEIKTFQELISVLTDHNHNSNKNNSIHCNSNLLEHTLKTTMNCQLSLPPSTLDRPILVNDELWEIMCQMWSYNPQNRPTAVQVNDKLKCLYDNIVGKSNLIDFHYICHEHQHHENHNCSHENCLSISSFTETHNHSVHRYENTNEST